MPLQIAIYLFDSWPRIVWKFIISRNYSILYFLDCFLFTHYFNSIENNKLRDTFGLLLNNMAREIVYLKRGIF
jgi:hypothetical protein